MSLKKYILVNRSSKEFSKILILWKLYKKKLSTHAKANILEILMLAFLFTLRCGVTNCIYYLFQSN